MGKIPTAAAALMVTAALIAGDGKNALAQDTEITREGVKKESGTVMSGTNAQTELLKLGVELPNPQFEGTNFKEYYTEIQKDFGEDLANIFRENAEYFVDIVKKGTKEDTVIFLRDVFNGAGDELLLQDFLSELNDNLKPGIEIDQNKISKLTIILEKVGAKLDWGLEGQRLALASQEEILAKYKSQMKEGKKKIIQLKESIEKNKESIEKNKKSSEENKKSSEENKKSSEENKKSSEENKKIIEENKKEIKKIKQQMKERGGAIDDINKKRG